MGADSAICGSGDGADESRRASCRERRRRFHAGSHHPAVVRARRCRDQGHRDRTQRQNVYSEPAGACAMKARGGFTLIEIVVAIVLTSVVALLAYGTAHAGIDTKERIETYRTNVEAQMIVRDLLF